MTRPKVDPEKRQRISQACESCKRRKQKCNGETPCSNCTKRSLMCTYGPSEHDSSQSASKRRMLDSPLQTNQGLGDVQRPTSSSGALAQNATSSIDMAAAVSGDFQTGDMMSRGSNSMSGQDEEAVLFNSSRMLQDPAGRLLYIGDSATLSFLQLVRMIVESTSGPSPFTLDPRRHRIVENTVSLPQNARITQLLPLKETAIILVNSFFDHTCGVIEIFSRSAFLDDVEVCYSHPLRVEPGWLCLLYLVFATGLVVATPISGTKEDLVIQKLRAEPLDRAEAFFLNAKSLGDPSTFENPDLWSIQALILMTLYLLAVSKRNSAYAYHGMAVRSAFALGLHREETMVIFSVEHQTLRRNLWRSLFVFDRFLSVSLGRPTSISEDDCSDTLLNAPGGSIPTADTIESQGLGACVRSCHFIGLVLEKVYSKRKISTKLAQELAEKLKTWGKSLDFRLHWDQAGSISQNQGNAILLVNMFYCHSVILLTRPFFLSVLRKVEQEKLEEKTSTSPRSGRMERFSEACLVASCHTIVLIQKAKDARSLSRRNPFVAYFLFSATLIVLCNEYAKLHPSPPGSEPCITNAINILSFMAEVDPQAQRLHYVLGSFHTVVINRYRPQNTQEPPIDSTLDPDITSTLTASESPFAPHCCPAPIPQPSTATSTETYLQSYLSNRTLSDPCTTSTSTHPSTPLFDFQYFSFGSDLDQHSTPEHDGAEIDFESLWNWLPGNSIDSNPAFEETAASGAQGMGKMGSQVPHQSQNQNQNQSQHDVVVPLYGTAFIEPGLQDNIAGGFM